MPRFTLNRWWTSVLTTAAVLALSVSFVSRSHADPSRESEWYVNDPNGSGLPPPTGVGDPDQPTGSNRLKISQRVSGYSSSTTDRGTLSYRAAGDSRVESSVWMHRFSVMARLLRSYWFRF